MTSVHPTPRLSFLLLAVLFAARSFGVPAHLAFEEHHHGRVGDQQHHHHPHDHDHQVDLSGSPAIDSAPEDHHHDDPGHRPHSVVDHYQDLLALRSKDAPAPLLSSPPTWVPSATVQPEAPCPRVGFAAPTTPERCTAAGPRAPPVG